MQTKIKTFTEIDKDVFDKVINEFTKDKKVVATQTHVNLFKNPLKELTVVFTGIVYFQE
jgi:hypothetical protein